MKVERKALIVATVASTIDQFCMNDVSILQQDYDVQVAANFTAGNNTSKERINEFKNELRIKNITINEIEFNRSLVCKNNIKAYRKLKKLIDQNSFDLIHCHTPIAAMFTRLAAKRVRTKGTKLIYTAHGFHFYKGAPLKNWLIYYPVERWLARYTDILITINKEDYSRAKDKFKAKKIEYIPGVGIDIDKFNTVQISKNFKRKELGLQKEAFVILSVGELNKNKNHETVIRALAHMNSADIHYVICGQGQLEGYLKKLIKDLNVEKQVHLLGFRKDIQEIYKACDIFVFPSYREGLPVALMEAMASGLPVICSDIRGNSDLIKDDNGGFLVKVDNISGYSDKIKKLYLSPDTMKKFGEFNKESLHGFSRNSVKKKITLSLKSCV